MISSFGRRITTYVSKLSTWRQELVVTSRSPNTTAWGNHFIIVDNRNGQYDLNNSKTIREMCDPRTGIGADGLLELLNCVHFDHKSCAYEIIHHLPDNRLGQMCGNGSRCVAEFARRQGIVSGEEDFEFCVFDGVHSGRFHLSEKFVEISIRDIDNITKYDDNNYYIWTGIPVHVQYVTANLASLDVKSLRDAISSNYTLYPEGAVVMFVQQGPRGEIMVRSYEGMITRETWSCGTGTTGAALVTHFLQNTFTVPETFSKYINIRLGQLQVKATRTGSTSFQNISLIGPACHVFDGVFKSRKIE